MREVLARVDLQVGQHETERAAGLEVPGAVGQRAVAVLEGQVLEDVRAVQPAARPGLDRQPGDDVAVADAFGKTPAVARVEEAEGRSLEAESRARVEVQPAG